MNYSLAELTDITGGELLSTLDPKTKIQELVFDSRKITRSEGTAFIAIEARRDGHDFISHAYERGCRSFIVSKEVDLGSYANASFLVVPNTVLALQKISIYHRCKYDLKVIGITGSNGKTIVKEWLSLLLSSQYKVAKNPKGWNSLIGVPLSLLKITDEHNLAVIETGISQRGEMQVMADMCQPTLGLITNIGDAHASGFSSRNEKLAEKLLLFESCDTIFYCKDHVMVASMIEEKYQGKRLISWSTTNESTYTYHLNSGVGKSSISLNQQGTHIATFYTKIRGSLYMENLLHCITVATHLGWTSNQIQQQLPLLKPIPYRSQILTGKNDSLIIDDSYSFDVEAMRSALGVLEENAGGRKKVGIFSDVSQHSDKDVFYKEIGAILANTSLSEVLHVGQDIELPKYLSKSVNYHNFPSLLALQKHLIQTKYENTAFLLKGARHFALEKLTRLLADRTHTSVLEINLESISHNIGVYSSLLQPNTKIMAIIKAGAYGSGSTELARHLEKQGIYGVAVATIDEGVALRKDGIRLPILILNPVPDGFHLMSEYQLEPEIYSVAILEQLLPFANGDAPIKIHIKIDTGMNRFGFERPEFQSLVEMLGQGNIEVHSIFSHLSASGDASKHAFTERQLSIFEEWSSQLIDMLPNTPLRHILNTNGILYYTDHQYEMVRMGLGMYGVTLDKKIGNQLKKAHRLTTVIAQLKEVKKGETVGYGAQHFLDDDKVIAHVPIGYADGIMRSMSHGRVSFYINGHLCPTIGYVCMDILMLDVTGHTEVEIGDVVEIFGDNVSIYDLSLKCETIPYEILTKISQRVKRVYIQD